MASVTQKIPNYVLGISQQPDEKKFPGQVNDLVNGLPDVVEQLTKRPGSHLISAISPSTAANSKWFTIYTRDDESYIGQVAADGGVKIFRCSDGVEIPVDYANIAGSGVATYLDNTALSDEKSSDIQALTINETTFFVNRRKTVEMKRDAASKSPTQPFEAYIQLDSIAYGKQYALDIYDPSDNSTVSYTRATSIAADEDVSLDGTSSTGANQPGNGDCDGAGREYVTVSTGTSIHSTSPPNASAGGKTNLRYEMDARCTPQPDDDHTDSEAQDNYHDTYQTYAKLQFGGEGWTTNDTHQHTSEKGLTTTVKITNHVTITTRANIAMVRPEATSSNAEEHVSADGILGELKATLDAISGTGITCTKVGNGLHLYRATKFGVTTPEKTLMSITTSEVNTIADLPSTCRHGYVVRVVNSEENQDDYFLKFSAEGIAEDIDQTGTYARSSNTITVTAASHGLSNGDQIILDITSGGATDGFYTIANVTTNTFTVTDSASGTISAGETCSFTPARFGEGVWEEVVQPGKDIEIDNTTMPIALTRVLPGSFSINGGGSQTYSNGAFRFSYPDWYKRDCGDDITNPEPSFIGQTIQKMVFFRNRIALLSAENVILSRVNDFYNFWNKTAMAISNADPIDLQSSSTYPTKLYDAVEQAGGLVIFSASEQFLLSSGAEALLTPETAKISYVSSHAFNPDTSPIELGTTIGFLNSTAKNTRFFEMAAVSQREEPTIVEQSKSIYNLFPVNTSMMTGSVENQMVLFGVDSTLYTASNEVWGYKFYVSEGRRSQSAWFRWTLPNNLVYHSIIDDVYYAVLNTGSTFTFEKFDIKIKSDTLMIGDAPEDNRVHLDTKKTFASGDLTYNSATDVTTFTLGAGYYSTRNLSAYCITDSDDLGKSYDIPSSAITGTAPNQTVTLPGNWKTSTEAGASTSSVNTDVIIGYEYEFEVELPTIYMMRPEGDKMASETRGSLVIHRMNFDFGDVGVIDVTLKRKGRDDYTYTVESKEWDNILASTPAIASSYLHTIPVYDRNTNLTVQIKSNHPSPATIHSMNWEGDYSPKYYSRV
ncbi:tail protein [Cyanophage NATL1A-7]|uniref:Tail tube protein B n=1 Tax=Cyanophage NATL1A-7 TaxID=445693 RepID=E3SN73_9CAUD|nr:tail protein [Cyanophage NATL1A-7]ADP00077.1 tail tube protein B [Cyanophage NATL1A-7]